MRLLRGACVRLVSWWLRIPVALRVLVPVAVMVVLWISSSRTPVPKPPSLLRALMHNGAHVAAYFGLAGTWLLALLPRDGARLTAVSRRIIAATITLSVAYGVVDEVHQSYVPGRHCSVWDIVCDACGSALAVVFVLWVLSGERRFATRIGLFAAFGIAGIAAATFLPG